jgi:two-component sensor histidine kinase
MVSLMTSEEPPSSLEQLLESPDLAGALESDRFKQFLDQVPIAVAVSELNPVEKVIYANLEFERLSGQPNTVVLGHGWEGLPGEAAAALSRPLAQAITGGGDYLGSFTMPHGDTRLMVDAWSNVIEDDEGRPVFRLVALVAAATHDASIVDELEERVREKDTQLLELQHRVKNNLQMITALIRVEARGVSDLSTGEGFDRLAGRIEALGLLYRALGDSAGAGVVDLGIYLSEIASAVMRAHATEGIHLDLQVDTWLVSLDVAMPTGLVVNELLTNALKHAFKGRDGGTISLHSTTDTLGGYRVLVGDDGVGLPEGYSWPKPGKLSALIVRSLLQNATARMDVKSAPGLGLQIEISFTRADAAKCN